MNPQQGPQTFSTPMDREAMVYDAKRGAVHVLNPTAALVWNLCDGEHSIRDIGERLAEAYEVPAEADLEKDVAEVLEQLRTLHLLAGDDTARFNQTDFEL